MEIFGLMYIALDSHNLQVVYNNIRDIIFAPSISNTCWSVISLLKYDTRNLGGKS